jgi:hypothetical protein
VLSIPLSRPVGILLVRVSDEGVVEGIASPIGDLRGAEVQRTSLETPEGIVGPLHALRGQLATGSRLIGAFGHGGAKRLNIDDVSSFIGRSRGELEAVVGDAATWARGRASSLVEHDLAVVVVARP